MEKLLKEIGLNGYESKIYLVLLQYGKLDAKSVSQYSKVPPTAVYPNLKSLLEKGLIQKFEDKIASYQILPPETAISGYVEDTKKKMNKIKEEIVLISKQTFQNKIIQPRPEVVHLSQGKDTSEQIYLDALSRTEKTYYILGWTFRTVSNKYTNLHQYAAAVKKKKVDMRIIVTGTGKKMYPVIKAYQEAGIKMRYFPLENFSIFISDQKECKITLKDKAYAQRYNLQIIDPNLSKVLQQYFLDVWEKSVEISPKLFN
ncbi:MAG: helix-turn-helix domain-containing protein [Candidatus Woesearchaeota archaeon]|jgi:sugar-specific transcriptional regulator TrmB